MKTRCALAVLVMVSVFAFGSPALGADPIKLKAANYLPPTHPMSTLTGWYCDEIKKRTNGQVEITLPLNQGNQVIGQILHKDPVPPRRNNRRIPVDLETICLKALEKDPDRRYQTARQMADDLRRFVNRFAISAKRTGPIGRAAKWARRHPAVAGL